MKPNDEVFAGKHADLAENTFPVTINFNIKNFLSPLQKIHKQEQLLGRLQSLVHGRDSSSQHVLEVLNYFLQRLAGQQTATRQLAKKVNARSPPTPVTYSQCVCIMSTFIVESKSQVFHRTNHVQVKHIQIPVCAEQRADS